MAEKLPARIGKYSITEVIGHGAMGVVYKGFDPHIQRTVAIKTLHRSLLGTDDQAVDSIAARFRNEAKAVGRIAHPGVVAIYEFGEDGETTFIAMEYVEGHSLDRILAGTPLLPIDQVLSLMDQLLTALEHAHRHGVWHRDIKPANLILMATGQLKLTDFGIARIENMALTQVSSMIGTPGYMAPEQYMGETVDHRADLFAAGVLLYQLLAGQAPFKGFSEQVMYRILHENPALPSQLTDRPACLDAVVTRAMAKTPEQRFDSAESFRQALDLAMRRMDQPPGAMVDAGDEDARTIVMPKAQWARMLEAAATTPSLLSDAAAHAPASAVLDVPTLSRIERMLASYVGPMARLMVRDAARHCIDVSSLATEVAQHIDVGSQRQQFIHEVVAASGIHAPSGGEHHSSAQPLGSALHSGASTPPAIAAAEGGLPAADVSQPLRVQLSEVCQTHALQVLTRQLGPIAKVIVRRAAAQSQDRVQFWHRIVEACPELDADRLMEDLRAGPL